MHKIQEVFNASYPEYARQFNPSTVQQKAPLSIMNCKSGRLGYNFSRCIDCGHLETHSNSCRNRNCPCCQGILKELWIDARKAEVIDAPYFHVVFTLPAELNPLVYVNQSLLYGLMHHCASRTLLDLSADKKYLGATPGIIQVLHTWGQEMNFHPHIHCIVTGAGLTQTMRLQKSSRNFFIPVRVLGKVFRGKFMEQLQKLHSGNKLRFPSSFDRLRNSHEWSGFRNNLYGKTWIPYIKETFNGFGNAIDYLGRSTYRTSISNARIVSVGDSQVSFWANDYKTGQKKTVTLSHEEFIRRFLTHVLPGGFQKIRYYAIPIFRITG
ncbi:transposase [Clostridiales bacterium F-3ap]|uniref:Transposase n=1 Tax=Anaerotalea alkaliphila TaxID=2662126 RepID=A0A7X5HVN5_9FIRM|nr:transposase [Anaerotalea alkaliphila]NDL67512.1 transposase [Anaerotalea alkaliphila]